jgi:hypothetical protein
MSATAADLPDDVAILKAMVLAGLEREARMQHIIDQITRTTVGKRSEKLNEDQLALGLDDLDVARAELEALAEQAAAAAGQKKERARREPETARASLPAHLVRVEEVILPDETEGPEDTNDAGPRSAARHPARITHLTAAGKSLHAPVRAGMAEARSWATPRFAARHL